MSKGKEAAARSPYPKAAAAGGDPKGVPPPPYYPPVRTRKTRNCYRLLPLCFLCCLVCLYLARLSNTLRVQHCRARQRLQRQQEALLQAPPLRHIRAPRLPTPEATQRQVASTRAVGTLTRLAPCRWAGTILLRRLR